MTNPAPAARPYFGSPYLLRTTIAPASGAQARCDAIQADFRAREPERRPLRRDPPPLPTALIPTGDQLKLRLAEELEYARRMLDSMGDQLTSDMSIVMRHGTALQVIDIIGQMLGHIASVTRSSDPNGAVDRIGMCELKGRLLRSSID
ncbi:MAG: hypothetical protein ABIO80_02595 [Sphingomicrobium sp.]